MDTLKAYSFKTFSEKDMFECKLAGSVADFGYITNAERKAFFDFLLRMQFLKIIPPKALPGFDNRGVFLVLQHFQYASMDTNRPRHYDLPANTCFDLISYRINHRTMGMGIDA